MKKTMKNMNTSFNWTYKVFEQIDYPPYKRYCLLAYKDGILRFNLEDNDKDSLIELYNRKKNEYQ